MRTVMISKGVASSADRPPAIHFAALAGIVGPILFTIGFLGQEAFRRAEYSPVAEVVSALEAGPNGWIQQVNFFVFGLLLLIFAVGLHKGTARTRWGILGPALLGLAAVGPILAAALPLREDAAGVTYDPGGHFVAGMTFFLGMSLALVVLPRRLRRDPRFSWITAYTAVCGVLDLTGFFLIGRFVIPDDAPLHDYAGLAQRLILLVTFPCLIMLAVRLDARKAA